MIYYRSRGSATERKKLEKLEVANQKMAVKLFHMWKLFYLKDPYVTKAKETLFFDNKFLSIGRISETETRTSSYVK